MNVGYIISYLKLFGFDKETVTIIDSIIGKMQYGPFIDSIHNYLKKDNNWGEYRKIFSEKSISDNSIKFETESQIQIAR